MASLNANVKNLRPIKKGQRTKDEQKRFAQKGGLASGAKRRQLKTFKELLEAGLKTEVKTEGGQVYSRAEYIALKVLKEAQKGNLKAFEIVRDTIGQKPVDRVESKTEITGGNDLSKLDKNTLLEMAKAAGADINTDEA